jgi:hypothetical protein
MFGVNCLRGLFSRNKRMIAGNWKSNFTASEAVNFVRNTIQNIKFNPNNVGTPIQIQMSSSHLSPYTSHLYSPSIPTNSSTIGSLHKIVPPMALEHTPDKSAPNISEILASSGSSLVTLKEELSLAKKMLLSYLKLN